MLHRDVPHFQHFPLCILFVRERNRDHIAGGGFIDAGQDRTCQNAEIITAATNQIRKDHPVNQPMWMVGHENYWARFGNVLKFMIRRQQVNAHRLHRGRPKGPPHWCAATLECANAADDGDLAGQPFDRTDGGPLKTTVKGIRVG